MSNTICLACFWLLWPTSLQAPGTFHLAAKGVSHNDVSGHQYYSDFVCLEQHLLPSCLRVVLVHIDEVQFHVATPTLYPFALIPRKELSLWQVFHPTSLPRPAKPLLTLLRAKAVNGLNIPSIEANHNPNERQHLIRAFGVLSDSEAAAVERSGLLDRQVVPPLSCRQLHPKCRYSVIVVYQSPWQW